MFSGKNAKNGTLFDDLRKRKNGIKTPNPYKTSVGKVIGKGKRTSSGVFSSPSARPVLGKVGPTADSTGSQSTTPRAQATSLLNLHVKVLSQPLGAENQWTEKCTGRVEFVGLAVLVVNPRASTEPGTSGEGRGRTKSGSQEDVDAQEDDASATPSAFSGSEARPPSGGGSTSPPTAAAAADGAAGSVETTSGNHSESLENSLSNDILFEDIITEDTPFVGENCCIVWNSLDQQLSLCLMYVSEEGYVASWSALVALQQKAYPPIRFDVLAGCKLGAIGDRVSLSGETQCDAATSEEDGGALPYSYYIHDGYDPPLGHIERHTIALSLLENEHLLNASLYSERTVILGLLSLGNLSLLEQLVSADVYPLLAAGLGATETPEPWTVPSQLSGLPVTEDLASTICKDLRLHHLRDLLSNTTVSDEVLVHLNNVSHRLKNEALCFVLANDDLLFQAKDALMLSYSTASSLPRQPMVSGGGTDSTATTPTRRSEDGTSITKRAVSTSIDELEQQQSGHEVSVCQHLHFFRGLISLAAETFSKDLIAPVISKIFQTGLLEALNLVAEKFGLPAGFAASFAAGQRDGARWGIDEFESPSVMHLPNGSVTSASIHSAHSPCESPQAVQASSANAYSLAVEQELTALLNATLVRLNERQEETLLNDLIRVPVLNDPVKYNALMAFLVRPLLQGGPVNNPGRSKLKDPYATGNPHILFHVLGLHDDEGYAASQRSLDPENNDRRNQFHRLIISKYLMPASGGNLALIPPAPVPAAPSNMAAVKSTSVSMIPLSGRSANAGMSSQGISSVFIRVIEYLITLSSPENSQLSLKLVFSRRSRVLAYIEAGFDAAYQSRYAIGADDLCANLRLVKTILLQLVPSPRNIDGATEFRPDFPMQSTRTTTTTTGLSKTAITKIARTLTVERDTLGIVLRAYRALGGVRRNSVFHSTVLATLDLIDRAASNIATSGIPSMGDSESCGIKEVRDFLFFKHRDILPSIFAKRLGESMLGEVCARLSGREQASLNASVISNLSVDMARSTKLLYVDEVEDADAHMSGNKKFAAGSGLNAISAVRSSGGPDDLSSFPKQLLSVIEHHAPPSPQRGTGSPSPPPGRTSLSPGPGSSAGRVLSAEGEGEGIPSGPDRSSP